MNARVAPEIGIAVARAQELQVAVVDVVEVEAGDRQGTFVHQIDDHVRVVETVGNVGDGDLHLDRVSRNVGVERQLAKCGGSKRVEGGEPEGIHAVLLGNDPAAIQASDRHAVIVVPLGAEKAPGPSLVMNW